MLKKENTALFGLIGIMGALIVIGSYVFIGTVEMLAEPPSIMISAVPVFVGSIFSGMSLASVVKKHTHTSTFFSDSVLEMNHAEHTLPTHIEE